MNHIGDIGSKTPGFISSSRFIANPTICNKLVSIFTVVMRSDSFFESSLNGSVGHTGWPASLALLGVSRAEEDEEGIRNWGTPGPNTQGST